MNAGIIWNKIDHWGVFKNSWKNTTIPTAVLFSIALKCEMNALHIFYLFFESSNSIDSEQDHLNCKQLFMFGKINMYKENPLSKFSDLIPFCNRRIFQTTCSSNGISTLLPWYFRNGIKSISKSIRELITITLKIILMVIITLIMLNHILQTKILINYFCLRTY